MGSCQSAPISPTKELKISAPNGIPIYRRDLKDRIIVETMITREIERLKLLPNRNKNLDDAHLQTYITACWDTYRGLSELYVCESHAYNNKFDIDLDHWYEINLANPVLFDNLHIEGMDELLPGRLFTTRMPRNIKKDPASAEKFRLKCKEYNLNTALILTETEEYIKYAGADLEDFYRSLGLEIIHRPIADFTIPNQPDMIQNIKDITWRLAEGKNCLVHCAGGNGRTGMVIAGIVKNIGVHDPIAWVRRVKTQYVETYEQENFVKSMTPVLDSRLTQKFPMLAKSIVAEHILDLYKHEGLRKQASRLPSRATSMSCTADSSPDPSQNLHHDSSDDIIMKSMSVESFQDDGDGNEKQAVQLFTRAITTNNLMSPSAQSATNDTVESFKSSDSFSPSPSQSKQKLHLNTTIHHSHTTNNHYSSNNNINTPTTCLEDVLDDDPNDQLLDSCEGHDVAERSFYSREDLVSRLTQIDFNLAFDLINTSHSDHITVEELTTLFKTLGAHLSEQQVSSMMQLMDDDGRISREEFIFLMNSNSAKVTSN